MINPKSRILESLKTDQNALEQAVVSLDFNDKFIGNDKARGKYFADWIRSGKHLNGKFLEEARNMTSKYVSDLLPISLKKTRELIKTYQEKLEKLKKWEVTLTSEIDQLPFEEEVKKPIDQVCREENLY